MLVHHSTQYIFNELIWLNEWMNASVFIPIFPPIPGEETPHLSKANPSSNILDPTLSCSSRAFSPPSPPSSPEYNMFSFFPCKALSLSLSLCHTHTHTHTHSSFDYISPNCISWSMDQVQHLDQLLSWPPELGLDALSHEPPFSALMSILTLKHCVVIAHLLEDRDYRSPLGIPST